MKKKYSLVFAATALFILAALLKPSAVMALMLEMSTAELTRQADTIVRGKVMDMRSEWDPERRFIWTLVTIAVSRSIKGNVPVGQEVLIKTPGGVVGQIGQKTEHAAIFEKGEEVLLFINPEVYRGGKVFRVTGNFQGKHTIRDNLVIDKKKPVAIFLEEIEKAK